MITQDQLRTLAGTTAYDRVGAENHVTVSDQRVHG
jgi:hypothetical protein